MALLQVRSKSGTAEEVASKKAPYTTTLRDGKDYDPLKSHLPNWLRERLCTEAESESLAEMFCEPVRQIITSSEFAIDRIGQTWARRTVVDDKGKPVGIQDDTFTSNEDVFVARWVLDGEPTPELLASPKAFYEAGYTEIVPVSEVVFKVGKAKDAALRVQPHYRGCHIRRIKGKDGARDVYIYNVEYTTLVTESKAEQAARMGVESKDIPEDERARQVRVVTHVRGANHPRFQYSDGYFSTVSPFEIPSSTKVKPHGSQMHVHALMSMLDCQRQAQDLLSGTEAGFPAAAWATTVFEAYDGYYGVGYKGDAGRKTLGLHMFAKSTSDGACMASNIPEDALFSGNYLVTN
jgi:hypothetical protein